MSPIKRREFIRHAAAAGALVAVPGLVACGTPAPAPNPAASTSTAAPAKATAAAASKRGPSTGELRVSEPFLPAALDPDSGTASFNLQSLGVSETLMRYTSTLQVEPWIAKSLERVDDLTWTVTLRDDVTFWDGSKLDAEAVKASFVRTMEKQPGAADLLPKGTVLFELPIDIEVARGSATAPR
ncbi:MAG: ABC transporter substrate-binding protein [Chloroflexi bacterium]|nr:ABC transporter substrate-binding protein [Chloroflexota bacterium]